MSNVTSYILHMAMLYIQYLLNLEIRKISIIREKYGGYCDKLEEELQNNEVNSVIYSMALESLKDLLKTSEEDTSKDLCVKSIEKCRKLLQSQKMGSNI